MKGVQIRVIWLVAALLCVTFSGSVLAHTPIYSTESTPLSNLQSSSVLEVVRIKAETNEQRRQLVSLGIDLLEMREGHFLFALLTPEQQQTLQAQGWEVSIDAKQTAQLQRMSNRLAETGFPTGYRTVDETEQFLSTTAMMYPQLTRLIDYGDSWERVDSDGIRGHDLLALSITNHATPGPKPVFVLMGAIHARELTTSELVTRYIAYLLANYGSDPDVTWMLNEYEVVVVPFANPDGRVIAEEGKLQRKNTHPGTTTCGVNSMIYFANQPGVDLNRNASFGWGLVDSSSLSPCEQTYPGTSAASEPEEAALETMLRGLFVDQRGTGSRDAAPEDTSGVFISLHSYGNLVLWPWGASPEQAPNHAGLTQLGLRFAAFNGYAAQQSYDLYPTSGTTDDWLYGERGIASFTFEVGPGDRRTCAGFFPPVACLDGQQGGGFWAQNLPAFLYATRVARAPYTQPTGPDVQAITVISDTEHITVTATLANKAGSPQPVTGAEIYVGQSPWHDGVAIPMLPVDRAFDSTRETVSATLRTADIPTRTLLLIRGRSSDVWGPIWATWNTSTTVPYVPPTYHLWFPIVEQRT